jgi:hypothetical protein
MAAPPSTHPVAALEVDHSAAIPLAVVSAVVAAVADIAKG